MSDKSPRQSMTKKSGKSIKEKRAEKRAKDPATPTTGPRPGQEEVTGDLLSLGRHRLLGQGERAPPPAPPRPPRTGSRRGSRRRITLEHGYGERFGSPTASCADIVAGFATPRGDPGRLRRRGAAQAAARGRRGDAARAGPVGLAALRPGPGDDPARDRPRADPDRLRGDEPLDRRRRRRAARLPQEQRARRLLLGAAGPGADRHHRRLRSPPERGRDRVRRHGPRRGDRAERARRPRRRRAHHPRRRRGRLTDPLGADPPVRPRPRAAAPEPRDHRPRPGAAGELPRRERHRRQLHAAGHRRPADLPRRGRPRRLPAGQPHRRRVVRRGHGLRVGPADDVRRADVHRRGQRATTTRSTTARRTSGTRRPGRTARRCCRSCPWCWPARRRGTPTRRSARAIEIRDGPDHEPGDPARSRDGRPSTRTWSADRRPTRPRPAAPGCRRAAAAASWCRRRR